MSHHIICTVGTSLLTNDERPWGRWTRQMPLPSLPAVVSWLRDADPARASAETNTLRALGLEESDVITFLHSDTEEGRLCAAALQELYRPQVLRASIEKIGRLGYGAAHFTAGLKGLVDATLRLVRQASQEHRLPILCATGGFKAEMAFLNVLGALLDIEVVYLHEQHRELVRLPPLPITWNDELVLQHDRFFSWIDEEPRRSVEVESWLRSAPELRQLVEDDEDGHTYLTAAGHLLFQTANERRALGPRATWPPADPRPPAEKIQLSSVEHHRPKGWEQARDFLASIDCVTSIRYDDRAKGAKVRVLDPERGEIAVCLPGERYDLPLCVSTTASGIEQCQLVADYLHRAAKSLRLG